MPLMLELQQQQSNIGLVGCFAVVSIGFAVFAFTSFSGCTLYMGMEFIFSSYLHFK